MSAAYVVGIYLTLGMLYTYWSLSRLAGANSFYAAVVNQVRQKPALLLLVFVMIGSIWPLSFVLEAGIFVLYHWNLWWAHRSAQKWLHDHRHYAGHREALLNKDDSVKFLRGVVEIKKEWDDRARRTRALGITTEEFILEHGNRKMTPDEVARGHIRAQEILEKLEAGEDVEWPSALREHKSETT